MTIFKQWRDVLNGTKTQTRRANFIYKAGSTQAIVPQYLAPSVWWHPQTGQQVENPRFYLFNNIGYEVEGWAIKQVNACMLDKGYKQGKVLIVAKRSEPVQDITEADAIAEGVTRDPASNGWIVGHDTRLFVRETAVEAYAALWDSINTAKKWRWESNPVIVVVTFELVR